MRYWTRDIKHYATHYNNVDVLLVPLKECQFNKMKSQLKVIEAGFMDCAIIAQNFGPYQIDLKSAILPGGEIDPEGNSLLIDTSKNHKLWSKYIIKLAKDRELLNMIRENLRKTVIDKYSLKNVTAKRAEIYLNLLNN
jgi:glycosyltransferase involved in cell wall biosynthesis